MDDPFLATVTSALRQTRLAAVLILDDPAAAVQTARALLAGGVNIIELTLRTPTALDCLRAITSEVPEMVVGAGTVLTEQQADDARSAGAAFGVAPATNPDIIRHAFRRQWPFAPGVMTPGDIDVAVRCGCRILKFFPAEPGGGLPYLRSVAAPWAHLGLQFLPLGGIRPENLDRWLEEPLVLAVGGSWLAPQDAIAASDWETITRRAAAAMQTVRRSRSEGECPR